MFKCCDTGEVGCDEVGAGVGACSEVCMGSGDGELFEVDHFSWPSCDRRQGGKIRSQVLFRRGSHCRTSTESNNEVD